MVKLYCEWSFFGGLSIIWKNLRTNVSLDLGMASINNSVYLKSHGNEFCS